MHVINASYHENCVHGIDLDSAIANSFVCTLFTQNALALYFSELNLLSKIYLQHLNLVIPL